VSLDGAYDLAGINPLNPIILNPAAAQSVQLIVVPKDPRSALITIKDSATLLPLSGASVTLSGNGYNDVQLTGKGFINQTDWSGGAGQEEYVALGQYWADDGNVDVLTVSGDILLKDVFGSYNPSGMLESSIFNAGSPSNFNNLTWEPTDTPALAGIDSVKFQIATNATVTATTTWDFAGPDGTVATFYTTSDTPIYSGHNGDQFLRYRTYLSTATATVTPNVSDVAFTFTTSCTPPGQVIFTGLSAGTYDLTVSKSGYVTVNQSISISSNWAEFTVTLAP
jgi:hypothetical protein